MTLYMTEPLSDSELDLDDDVDAHVQSVLADGPDDSSDVMGEADDLVGEISWELQ